MNGVISRNVLIFGLGIGPQPLVDLVDAAGLVGVINGVVEAVVSQRCERERLALNHPRVPVDPVPPGELDRLASAVQPGQRVATNDVYIDKEGGVLVDDCAIVSRQISGVLDVEDPITSEYTLEVSSPGMERPLFTLEQFASFAGEQVKIKLRSPFEGRRNFQGLLRGVEEQDVVVQVEDHEFLLPIDMIDKANIIPSFD